MRNSESCPTQNTGDQNQKIVFIYVAHIRSGSDGAMRMSTAITSATVTHSHVCTHTQDDKTLDTSTEETWMEEGRHLSEKAPVRMTQNTFTPTV